VDGFPSRLTDLAPVDADRLDQPPASIANLAHGRRLALGAVVCLFAAYGLLYFYSDGRKLLAVASSLSWTRLAVPVLATLLSYALMALSYEGIATAAGTPIGFLRMLRITFVSNTVNYIVSTGGLSGFAIRMFFFRQSGIPIGRAITISFVQGLITNLALLAFLLMGFYFLLTDEPLGTTTLASAALLLGIFLGLTAVGVFLLVRPRLRKRFLLWSVETAHRLARRFLPAHQTPRRVRLWRLQRNIDHGFAFLLAKWQRMLLPAAYIILDWILTIGVLWGCFWCVGVRLPFPLATIGFAVGILTSMVSVVPGGIGIMEGSMTLVFVGLGVDREPTVIAVLLFRLTYYAIPFLVSLAFFRAMLSVARHQGDAAA
jgi:uncharacterized protein (TIRG00374 family)